MDTSTKDSISDLRFMLDALESDGPMIDALHNIVRGTRDALDGQANVVVAVTSIIACEPANRRVVSFAGDAIENARNTLDALERIDAALDVLMKPLTDRHEAIAYSVKAVTS